MVYIKVTYELVDQQSGQQGSQHEGDEVSDDDTTRTGTISQVLPVPLAAFTHRPLTRRVVGFPFLEVPTTKSRASHVNEVCLGWPRLLSLVLILGNAGLVVWGQVPISANRRVITLCLSSLTRFPLRR